MFIQNIFKIMLFSLAWLDYFKYRRLYCFSSRGSALTISNDVTALEIMTRPGQSRALPVLTDSSAVFYLGVLPV